MNIFPYLRTLLVDEHSISRRLLKTHLALIGFVTVEEAEDAIEASQAVANNEYDLIFISLNLSEISGLEFLDYLRGHRKSRSSLLIGMGEDRVRLRTVTIRAGADAYLDRPTSPDRVEKMLHRLFSSQAARKAKIVPICLGASCAFGKLQPS